MSDLFNTSSKSIGDIGCAGRGLGERDGPDGPTGTIGIVCAAPKGVVADDPACPIDMLSGPEQGKVP